MPNCMLARGAMLPGYHVPCWAAAIMPGAQALPCCWAIMKGCCTMNGLTMMAVG